MSILQKLHAQLVEFSSRLARLHEAELVRRNMLQAAEEEQTQMPIVSPPPIFQDDFSSGAALQSHTLNVGSAWSSPPSNDCEKRDYFRSVLTRTPMPQETWTDFIRHVTKCRACQSFFLGIGMHRTAFERWLGAPCHLCAEGWVRLGFFFSFAPATSGAEFLEHLATCPVCTRHAKGLCAEGAGLIALSERQASADEDLAEIMEQIAAHHAGCPVCQAATEALLQPQAEPFSPYFSGGGVSSYGFRPARP